MTETEAGVPKLTPAATVRRIGLLVGLIATGWITLEILFWGGRPWAEDDPGAIAGGWVAIFAFLWWSYGSEDERQAVTWGWAAIITVFFIAFLGLELRSSESETMAQWLLFGPALALVAYTGIIVLFSSADRPSSIRGIARLATSSTMLMALWAFGIERDTRSVATVDWESVPSILIIFLLVELASSLMLRSRDIADESGRRAEGITLEVNELLGRLDEASKRVTTLVEEAGRLETAIPSALSELQSKMQSTFTEARKALSGAIGGAQSELGKATNRFEGVSTELQAASAAVSQLASDSDALRSAGLLESGKILAAQSGWSEAELWTKLNSFTRFWTFSGEQSPISGGLVGGLLDAVTGSSRGETATGAQPPLKGSFQSDVDSITCVTTDAVYVDVSKRWLDRLGALAESGTQLVVRATTTLTPPEFLVPGLWWTSGVSERPTPVEEFVSVVVDFCRKYDVQYDRLTILGGAAGNSPWNPGEGRGESNRTLDDWFVLDPRLNGVAFQDAADEKAMRVLRGIAPQGAPDGGPGWLSGIQASVTELASRLGGAGLLPQLPTATAFPLTLPTAEGEPVSGFLMYVPGSAADTEGEGRTTAEAMRGLGWRSVRQWYQDALHSGSPPVANWCRLSDQGRDQLRTLAIDWNGRETYAFDVLLVGIREGDDVRWVGAAVSNISFDRPECTIKLTFGEPGLSEIGTTVDTLFEQAAAGTGTNVLEGGTWDATT